MNVDVSERFSDGTGKHNARIVLGSAEADLLIGCLSKGWGTRWATYIINSKRKRGTALASLSSNAQLGLNQSRCKYGDGGSSLPSSSARSQDRQSCGAALHNWAKR